MDTKEIVNRKARHDFEVLDTCEAGIALKGTEVKSIRQGRASLQGAFARIIRGEVWLIGAHIAEYLHGNRFNHDPLRFRKLLLHRAEIRKLKSRCETGGSTLVPLRIFFNPRGYAKVELAVARSKTHADRRQDLRKRDMEREIRRKMGRIKRNER